MEQSLTPQQIVAARLPLLRGRHGWSTQKLADRITELGGDLSRTAITKIETGRRDVKLDEAMLLAVALDVSPSYFFVPVRRGETVSLTPNLTVTASEARYFVKGSKPLPGQDPYIFRSEVNEELVEDREFWQQARTAEERANELLAQAEEDNDPKELQAALDVLQIVERRMRAKFNLQHEEITGKDT